MTTRATPHPGPSDGPDWIDGVPYSADQPSRIAERAREFLATSEQTSAALRLLIDRPGADDRFALEAIHLMRTASSAAEECAMAIAVTAEAEPMGVSIPRLAKALGVSVNTLRSRLPRIAQTTATLEDPFEG